MRYYVEGQSVLVNCGTGGIDNWIPGTIINTTHSQYHQYEIELKYPVDGESVWYFSVCAIVEDNNRNRRNRGMNLMNKKRGRPPDPTRKNKKVTWVMLTNEHRRILNADFGSFQAGLEKLVELYAEQRKVSQARPVR